MNDHAQVRFALENVFEGVHGAGELGGVSGSGSGGAIRVADQARMQPLSPAEPRFRCTGACMQQMVPHWLA